MPMVFPCSRLFLQGQAGTWMEEEVAQVMGYWREKTDEGRGTRELSLSARREAFFSHCCGL